jgi:hypothetical protein
MNWGHKLFLVFVVFAGGMFFLVYKSMHTNYELVSKEYYKDELTYQTIIDGVKSANALSDRLKIFQNDEIVTVQLPAEMKNGNVSGNIWFYCASDASKDRHITIRINENAIQQIDKEIFLPGTYEVKVDWTKDYKHYYTEQPLTIF